jgi:hypothetical protein
MSRNRSGKPPKILQLVAAASLVKWPGRRFGGFGTVESTAGQGLYSCPINGHCWTSASLLNGGVYRQKGGTRAPYQGVAE